MTALERPGGKNRHGVHRAEVLQLPKRLASPGKNEEVERKCVERQGRKDVRKECPLAFGSLRGISRSGAWGKIRDTLIILKVIGDFIKRYLPS
jgi:hypothetical protein